MSLVHVPRLIQHASRNARNGMVPSALTYLDLIAAENHITAFRHRQVYCKSLELGTDTTGVTALGGRWRFRTGYGVDRCVVLMLMGLTSASAGAGSTADPIASVAMTISGGATTTVTFNYGVSTATITDGPDEHNVMMQEVAVTENTVYECLLSNTGAARPLAIMVYELAPTTISESTSYFNTHAPTGGSPILDADRERLFLGMSNMYRRNGAINAHWSLFDGTARTRSNATACNLIDGTQTGTPTTASYGWYIDPRYHRTMSRTTVPFEWGVYASMSAGSGTCRIIDTAGTTYGTITVNSATPQWWTATLNLAESAELFIVPQFAGDGAGTLSVYAASLIEHDG